MSNFKTHKIASAKKYTSPSTQKIVPSDATTHKTSGHTKKWIIGILILIAGILFAGNIALRALADMSISEHDDGTKPFIPTIVAGTGAIEKVKGTKNILIAGIGGAGHEGSSLTDSIMLASINNDKNSITLISIPRDLYVAYPKGYGSAGRINTLYTLGKSDNVGIKLLAEKVSEITGQPIDGYIVIDFTGFKYVINALGGIDIDVPRDLYDKEYPNNNWGYEIFSVQAGLQTMDGETALKYARSRHSTSDFDRSERQQLIIKAIKEKALSLGFLSSPSKINEVLAALRSHIDTSMTVGEAADLAIRIKDIDSESITIYNLNNECVGTLCTAGAYLYTPSREYFGGSAVLIPENASMNKLSYYEDIRRFSGFIFHFPEIRNNKYPISVIAGKGKGAQARTLIGTLGRLGIGFDGKKNLLESTGSIGTSHINIYWNKDVGVGIPEDSLIVEALKFLEEKIPYSTVIRNEYITTDGPRIEIVIGDDIRSYFTFAKPAYYLPYLASSGSGEDTSQKETLSAEKNKTPKSTIKPPQNSISGSDTVVPKKENDTSDISITPGQWEEF